MKKNFQRFTSLFLVFVTLFNTVISPFTVLADTNTPNKGDLRLEDGNQYTSKNGESVVATEGSYNQEGDEGDVQVRKIVTKLDDEGNYQVKFEARGKRTSKVTKNAAEMYVVVVFDRSNSMTESGKNLGKWTSAINGAKSFAKKLNENFNSSSQETEKKANIALVTFNSYATVSRNFVKNDFTVNDDGKRIRNDSDLFGNAPIRDNNGGTNLQAGLIKAYELLSNVKAKEGQEIKKYIVVMGDGAPTYYTDNNQSVSSYGSSTSPTTITKTLDYATTVKNADIEVFTIGYNLPNGNVCSNYKEVWNGYEYVGGCEKAGYESYTAETILKKIATDENHFTSSNESNIADAFNNIVEKTSYQPAATNIKIVDNIGSNFTSTDSRVINNQITLTLDKTTVEDNDNWQTVGQPFTITIDKDSSGWNETNNNFTYSYIGINGEVKEESVKNPEVYWIANEYEFRVEYYYDNQIDNNLTESGKGVKGAEIEVLDTTINDKAHLKDGYKLVKVEPNKKITIKNNGENVIRVYYEKANYDYKVEYYYDGKIDNSKTETSTAKFESTINTYIDKNITGYKFDKKENLPLTITSDSSKNVIKIYYVKDDSQRKDLKYTVKYYKDGVLQENDTQIVTKNVQVLEPDTLEVDKSSINTKDKYYGYKFVKTNPSDIPDTINNEGVIEVYYVKDDSQRKDLKYTVKYYKDGVLQENDTQIVTKNVQVLEPDTLEVDKNSINTINKYDGYKFVKTNPSNIPDTINNEGVIEVYYEKDNFEYSVEYYYDGVKDDSKTETSTAEFESVISNYTDKNITGYKFDKKENLPLTITSDSSKNVIKIYYVKDKYGYKVEYYYDGKIDDSKTYTDSALYNSKVENYPNGDKKGFSFVSDTAPLTITEKTENNIIKVYYESNVYEYTIYHVEENKESNILDTVKGSAKYEEEIAVTEKEFTGFTYTRKDKEVIKIDTENNIAYVYYTRNNYNYKVEHYLETKDGKFELEKTEEVNNVSFESNITYEVLDFNGYKYDETRTEAPEKVLEDNLVVRLYYVLADSKVTVHYVVKVDDNYISFDKYGRDEFGNNTEDFKNVDLLDDILTGKIGTNFTTKYREVNNYKFIGIYNGNILDNTDLEKLDGTSITGEFDFEEQEYTYVYEAPKGGDEIPPQTGMDTNISYLSYILLVAVIYVLKKYFDLISE